jgi:hypothetical protein
MLARCKHTRHAEEEEDAARPRLTHGAQQRIEPLWRIRSIHEHGEVLFLVHQLTPGETERKDQVVNIKTQQ